MEDEIFHGIEAKKRIISNPASTHQRFRDSLDQESKFEDLKNHLIYLRSTAENFIGRPVDGCVIAVPHTFSSRNRTTLESVATVSGFRICQIVSEPVTSLLAYVSATPDIQYQKQLGLVIEFGGTACSVSLIHCFGGKFAVLGSNTSDELSGAHLDIILRDYLRGVFEKENGVTLDGLKALAKLEQEAEQARVTLSSSPKATISIDGIMGEIDFHTAVTRLRADMLFRQFYKDFASFVTGTLTSHGLTTKDVGLVSSRLFFLLPLTSSVRSRFPAALQIPLKYYLLLKTYSLLELFWRLLRIMIGAPLLWRLVQEEQPPRPP